MMGEFMNNRPTPTKTKKVMWQCRYCGYKSIRNATDGAPMTNANCPKHPQGWCKGVHSWMKTYLYVNQYSAISSEKKVLYQCRYCGFKSTGSLTQGIPTIGNCPKHPSGWCKGQHSWTRVFL